jgi:SAM-dependent methyltransferase
MKKLLLSLLLKLGVYPHIYFTYSPFKVYEFERLTGHLTWTGEEEVLDIGCGAGLQTLLLGKGARRVTGIDVNPDFIEEARWAAAQCASRVNARFLATPLEEAGLEADSLDRVFSICVIEHIPNHEEVLAECLRLLKPGGAIHFSVDNLGTITDPELKRRHSADHAVVRYYEEQELAEMLQSLGFVDVEVETIFRSELARELFERGIREGFNFGRFATPGLSRRLREAEDAASRKEGIFLVAHARKTPVA